MKALRPVVSVLALLCFAGAAHAQYVPDASTAALYHFDTQTPEGTTPDAGPNALDGTLAGAVLPEHVAATVGGYGFAYKFDGVDRGVNNSRIGMGTDQRLGFRGAGDWTLDILLTVTTTLADDGYFRGIACRASAGGIDYSLSYSSWTSPSNGPEHEFWFTTGLVSGASPDYAFAATAFSGVMQVGSSYAIRVTSVAGTVKMTVNGIEGTSTYYPEQPGYVPPTAMPIVADLTVGDACMEDFVIKPSELQIDEFRISNGVRLDLPLLPFPLPVLIPLNLGLGTDASAFQAYRADRVAPKPALPLTPPLKLRRLR